MLYLKVKGLWNIVEGSSERPRGISKLEGWDKSNNEALHTIFVCCGQDVFPFIRDMDTAKEAWNTLAEKLANKDRGRSDLHGNELEKGVVTKVDKRPGPDKEVGIEAVEAPLDNILSDYDPFFKALNNSDWDAIMSFIKLHPEAVRARAPSDGTTALHKAAIAQEVAIVKELVQLMTTDDLEILDNATNTVLIRCIISQCGDTNEAVQIAKCLVEKNNKLLTMVDIFHNTIALVNAFIVDRPKIVKYLYSVTPLETNIRHAAELISRGLRMKKFDIAWDLIQRDPSLVLAENCSGKSPMNELACMPSAFLSGDCLNIWEKWIYNSIHIEPTSTINTEDKSVLTMDSIKGDKLYPTVDDVYINVRKHRDNQTEVIHSGFRGFIVASLRKFFGVDHIYHKKRNHYRILEFLNCMCEVTKRIDLSPEQHRFVQTSIFQAIERGIVEFIVHVFRAKPKAQRYRDEKGRPLFHFAVACRQEKIVNLIHGFTKYRRQDFLKWMDSNQNNVTHMVGFVSSSTQVNRIRGAALQMQRELQWFKELEKMTSPEDLEVLNDTDDMKPRELFTKNHIELVKEGEKSMKDTATSCTVVGALIVTMMFAAAFTIPGGTNGDTGVPILLEHKVFKVYIVADAISLLTSTSSVMMFLGILTSRYAEDDFLVSLPRKMILGLLMLFLSVVTMMVAFSSALFLMFPAESWIAITASLLSSLPVFLFVWMQFPFLLEILISTYRPRLFDKKVERWGY